jgi:hypothetical protein
MNWEQVGSYCGRAVLISRFEESEICDGFGGLSDSILLVVLKAGAVPGTNYEALFRALAVARPLSICLFGTDAEEAFGALLEVLSYPMAKDHIMTKICHGEIFREGLDDFLESSWPSEERHDNWTSCRILVIGNEWDYHSWEAQLRKKLA